MKGQGEIVAIVLIIIVVVAMVALAYTWFTGVFERLTRTTAITIEETAEQMRYGVILEGAACDDANNNTNCDNSEEVIFAARNSGSVSWDANLTSFYIKDRSQDLSAAILTCNPALCDNLPSGGTVRVIYNLDAGDSYPCDTSIASVGIVTGLKNSITLKCI